MVRKTLKNTYHTSSLYLLKFLLFLTERPLKRAELQTIFAEDPDCLNVLSVDTLRLYANALEELGCVLERPDKSNNYHYRLLHTPFMVQFTPEEWQSFLRGIETLLDTYEIPKFIRIYEVVLSLLDYTCFNPKQKNELQALLSKFQEPYQFKYIKLLERAKYLQDAFMVSYEASSGVKEWQVLHDTLIVDARRMYWLCYHYDAEKQYVKPLMLRMDKCRNIFPMQTPRFYEESQLIQDFVHNQAELSCLIVLPKGINFIPPCLKQEQYHVMPESQLETHPHWQTMKDFYGMEVYAVSYRVKTSHYFYLMQSLQYLGGFIAPENQAFLEAWHAHTKHTSTQEVHV